MEALPLALSAIRAIPNKSTGWSPFSIVFGHTPRSVLDILYEGWSNPSYNHILLSQWVVELLDRLEAIRDSAILSDHLAKLARCAKSNKGRKPSRLQVGEKVLTRIPGLRGNLLDAWEVPSPFQNI